VELVAEAVELLNRTPGVDPHPSILDPEVVRQAVQAVAASRRLQLMCVHKAGDSDPEEAQVKRILYYFEYS
jgi:hypothetical protein